MPRLAPVTSATRLLASLIAAALYLI
jgi:hypothetical protein